MEGIDEAKVVEVLNSIVEHELAGAVMYTQYSMMVFGHSRIPITGWMRGHAAESLDHACQAGEEITSLGAAVSLGIGQLVGSHVRSIDEMLTEMLAHERAGIELYHQLHDLTAGRHIPLEEYARQMIRDEELHAAEMAKMMPVEG